MLDTFTNLKRIIKSHVSAVNVSMQIDVLKGPSTSVTTSESQILLKRDRSLGSNDRNPRKKLQKMTLQKNLTKKFKI